MAAAMQHDPDTRELAEAYRQWLEVQRELADAMFLHQPQGLTQSFAEGYQHLIRLMSSASLMYIEMDDPENPRLYQDTDDMRKLSLDNPDNHYLRARIAPAYRYRLCGRLGNSLYHGLTIECSHLAPGGHTVLNRVELEDYLVDGDGNFEVWLGGERRASHWLPLPEEAHSIFLRQTFPDREHRQEAQCRIERLGAPHYQPPTPQMLALRIRNAAAFAKWWCERAYAIGGNFAGLKNTMAYQGRQYRDPGGDPLIDYIGGGWELAPDEALQIRFRATSGFCYWGFQLANCWAESLDYRFLNVSLNHRQAVANSDGSWTLVLAHVDPSVPNWLTVAGHQRGIMALRWLKAVEEPTVPAIRLVKLSEIRR